MTNRRYRRKRSMSSGMLLDISFVANRFSWKGAIVLGVVLFSVFYWLLPLWLNNQLNTLEGNIFRPMIEVLFAKRVHWVQWLGIALGLVCTYFAIHNYLAFKRLGRNGEANVSFFSRLLARWLD